MTLKKNVQIVQVKKLSSMENGEEFARIAGEHSVSKRIKQTNSRGRLSSGYLIVVH